MGMGTQSVRITHGSNVTIKQGDVAYGHTETCKVVLAFHGMLRSSSSGSLIL